MRASYDDALNLTNKPVPYLKLIKIIFDFVLIISVFFFYKNNLKKFFRLDKNGNRKDLLHNCSFFDVQHTTYVDTNV